MKIIHYKGKIKKCIAIGSFGKFKKLAQNNEIVQVKGTDCIRMGKYFQNDFGMIRIEFIKGGKKWE